MEAVPNIAAKTPTPTGPEVSATYFASPSDAATAIIEASVSRAIGELALLHRFVPETITDPTFIMNSSTFDVVPLPG